MKAITNTVELINLKTVQAYLNASDWNYNHHGGAGAYERGDEAVEILNNSKFSLKDVTEVDASGFEDWLNEGGYKLESLESDEIDLNELKIELNCAYARYISPSVAINKLPMDTLLRLILLRKDHINTPLFVIRQGK